MQPSTTTAWWSGGGAVDEPGEGAGRPGGDGAGPSGEGRSTGAAEVAAERARADAAEVHITTLTAQVEALEDFGVKWTV